MKTIKTNPLVAFLAGALSATWLLILIYFISGAPALSSKSASSEDTGTQEITTYVTDIKEWYVLTDSGESFTFHTPDGFYSLSDRYLDDMTSYYGVEVESDHIVVVGDSTNTANVNNYINANTLSDVKSMLKQLYGDAYSEEDMVVSEALHYMQNGELPEELPLNYTIDEIKTYDINGVQFHTYAIAYDIEYEVESTETTESTEATTSTATERVEQVICYSDTEDPIEIVITQYTYDQEAAIALLDEFLGQ